MPKHPVPKSVLISTTCKRCQWFENKTTAKEKGIPVSREAFGRCVCSGGGDLFDRPVPSGPVACPHFIFKPCSGSGNSYAVINTRTVHISFITPIQIEAKIMAEKANNPDVIAVELTKVK